MDRETIGMIWMFMSPAILCVLSVLAIRIVEKLTEDNQEKDDSSEKGLLNLISQWEKSKKRI